MASSPKFAITAQLYPYHGIRARRNRGGYRAPSCLDSPIDDIADKAKIGKALSPRFMRRTFQDLGRSAQVHDFVVRAIPGHATTTMQEHYSSVSGDEVRTGLGKVVALILPRPGQKPATDQGCPSPASLREATSPRFAGRGDEAEVRAAS